MQTLDYPNTPGFKATATETSRQAAVEMIKPAETLRRRCLERLTCRRMTVEELADELFEGEDAGARERFVGSVRPRVSELVKQGKVFATPERRTNRSGKTAVVWTAGELKQSALL